jgi:hypothetical protein
LLLTFFCKRCKITEQNNLFEGEFLLKKILGLGLSFCIVAILTGCSGTTNSSKSSTESKSSHSAISTSKKKTTTVNSSVSKTSTSNRDATSASSSTASKAVWNTSKNEQLATYMASFSSEMDQQYVAYTPGNSVNYYGIQAPDELLGTTRTTLVAVNDAVISTGWSDSGESAKDYTIVACYSDAIDAGNRAKSAHLYFFAFHNGQPVVLVTEQNQGANDGALHFTETQNQELKAAYAKIVGQAISSTSSTATVVTIENAQQAIDFLKARLDYDDDIIYQPVTSTDSSFQIQLISQSLRAQGGSGTVDQYRVTRDGQYFEGAN